MATLKLKSIDGLAKPVIEHLEGDKAASALLAEAIALFDAPSHPSGEAQHVKEEQRLNEIAFQLQGKINEPKIQPKAIALFDAIRLSLQD